jgi:fructose transport system ATP-binding protein
MIPDQGSILVDATVFNFKRPQDARDAGIETVYQTLAVAPALDIASNLFLAREIRRKGPLGSVLRMLDTGEMKRQAADHIKRLGISTLQNINQAVETLSGGQRQAVAVARAGAFGGRVVILDEPTAALGVRETGQVLKLVRDLRDQGLGVILISHNMPNVFEVADRIHIQRLGSSVGVITPKSHSMEDAVAIMTGARKLAPEPG